MEKRIKNTSLSRVYKKLENEQLEMIDWLLEESLITEDDFRGLLASAWVERNLAIDSHDELLALVREYEKALHAFSTDQKHITIEGRSKLLNLLSRLNNKVADKLIKGIKLQKSAVARKNVNKLHDKPGGSREKQAAIRKIWASGKYSSRDICAEQECAALDMSFSTARKALRNTPDPT